VPTLPPAANPLLPSTSSPWLAPIRFRVKAYFDYCRSVDESLTALEARYPSHKHLLTIEGRAKQLRRKRKPK
jgi:hypothetical protein